MSGDIIITIAHAYVNTMYLNLYLFTRSEREQVGDVNESEHIDRSIDYEFNKGNRPSSQESQYMHRRNPS